MSHNEVEYRSYGLYSDVAKEIGCTVGQIDTVYSWYLNKTCTDLLEKPTCQIFLKGLGMLQISLPKAVSTLSKNTYGLQQSFSEYLNGTAKEYVSRSYLSNRTKEQITATISLKKRINFMLAESIINDTMYQNKMTRVETIESTLNQLYESIQRIPEFEQKRTAECGQSASRSDEQNRQSI
jgi:hypothetical protein